MSVRLFLKIDIDMNIKNIDLKDIVSFTRSLDICLTVILGAVILSFILFDYELIGLFSLGFFGHLVLLFWKEYVWDNILHDLR